MSKYNLLFILLLTSCGMSDKPVPPKPEPKVEEPIEKEPPKPIHIKPSKSELAEKKQEEERLGQQQEEINRVNVNTQREKELAAQRALEEAKKAEQERINKEALETRYKDFVSNREKLITTLEALLPKIKYQTMTFEDQLKEANGQITGRKNRIREIERQINAQRELLESLPKDSGKVACPNMLCGKYTGTDTMVSTCPYCGTALRKNNTISNQKKEITSKIEQLNKSLQREQQLASTISIEELQANLEQFKNIQPVIIQAIVNLKYSQSKTDEENIKQIEALEQIVKIQTELVNNVKTMIPNFKEPTQATTKVEPVTAPKKVYTLINGQTIEVKSEMIAGDEIIVKTTDGKMVTINKKDIVK